MIEKQIWHPVAQLGDVADAPLAVRLLGEDIVLWRDAAGAVQAWSDRCPHRGAQLSLGKLVPCAKGEGRTLECPYHGWQFASGGQPRHHLRGAGSLRAGVGLPRPERRGGAAGLCRRA